MLHQKSNGVAALSATKTFVNFFYRGNSERRAFFIVKGAKAEVVGPSFFELYKRTDDINDINAALYLLYGLLTDQNVNMVQNNNFQNIFPRIPADFIRWAGRLL